MAQEVLKAMKTALKELKRDSDVTIQELLDEKVHVSLEDYQRALSVTKSGQAVALKRKVSDRNVNQYCPAVTESWEANTDMQFVLNPYACVMYISSYVMKAEKGMGNFLNKPAKK